MSIKESATLIGLTLHLIILATVHY